MKRAEALRPLSRDHLGALMLAKQLRETTDRNATAAALLEFWEQEGRAHFHIEEDVLLPGWSLFAEIDRDAAQRMLDDHLMIRRQILRLTVAPKEVTLVELSDLGRLLKDHVRFEERELFPMIEAALDPADLDSLTQALDRAEAGVKA